MRNVMNIESVKNCSGKLEMYLREEQDFVTSLSNHLKKLNDNCNALENRTFRESLEDLKKSMDKVHSNHEIDNLIIKENVKSYIITSKKVENQMNDEAFIK